MKPNPLLPWLTSRETAYPPTRRSFDILSRAWKQPCIPLYLIRSGAAAPHLVFHFSPCGSLLALWDLITNSFLYASLFKATFKAVVAISQANCKSEGSRDAVRLGKQIAHNNHIFLSMCQYDCIISSIYVWPGGRKVDYFSFSSKNPPPKKTHKVCCQMNWKIDPSSSRVRLCIMMQLWCLYGLHVVVLCCLKADIVGIRLSFFCARHFILII